MLKRISRLVVILAVSLVLVGLGIVLGQGVNTVLAQEKAAAPKKGHKATEMPYCDGCFFIVTLESDPHTFNASTDVLSAVATTNGNPVSWDRTGKKTVSRNGSRITIVLKARRAKDDRGRFVDGTGTLVVQTTDDGTTPTSTTDPSIDVEPIDLDPCSRTLSPPSKLIPGASE